MFGTFSYPWSDWLYLGIYTGFILTIIFTTIVIVLENRNPVKSLAWIVVLVFSSHRWFHTLPLLRTAISPHAHDIEAQKAYSPKNVGQYGPYKRVRTRKQLSPESLQQIKLGYQLGGTQLFVHNHIEIFTDGESKFKALIEDLNRAETFIHLQYYIFDNDTLGRTIKKILIEKARQGVKVRVLYDDVGCWKVRSRFFREMRKAELKYDRFSKYHFHNWPTNSITGTTGK